MYRAFPRPSPEKMLEASIRTFVRASLKGDDEAPEDEKTMEAHIEFATCVLLEDFYRGRKDELAALLGFDGQAKDEYADAVRKMFL